MNSVLKRLGFDKNDKVVILHADDLGMCEATISAFADLVDFGLVRSGSVMVPCPWFPHMAAFGRDHSELDIGVHLTLTCEWDRYCWGPLSTRDSASGLLDERGYFHQTQSAFFQNVQPAAVFQEMNAQIDAAQKVSMPITHLDTHMLTTYHAEVFPYYLELGGQLGIPSLVTPNLLQSYQLDEEHHPQAQAALLFYQQRGLPIVDHWVYFGLRSPINNRTEEIEAQLKKLSPGLSFFCLHPARDTPELRALAPDWQARVGDYEAFLSKRLKQGIHDQGIQIIQFKDLTP